MKTLLLILLPFSIFAQIPTATVVKKTRAEQLEGTFYDQIRISTKETTTEIRFKPTFKDSAVKVLIEFYNDNYYSGVDGVGKHTNSILIVSNYFREGLAILDTSVSAILYGTMFTMPKIDGWDYYPVSKGVYTPVRIKYFTVDGKEVNNVLNYKFIK